MVAAAYPEVQLDCGRTFRNNRDALQGLERHILRFARLIEKIVCMADGCKKQN